jgi:hypothetical protein
VRRGAGAGVGLYVKTDDRTEEAILRSAFMRLAAQQNGGRVDPDKVHMTYSIYCPQPRQAERRTSEYR